MAEEEKVTEEKTATVDEAVAEAEIKNQEAIGKMKVDLEIAESSISSITDSDLKAIEEAKINLLKKKIAQAEGTYKTKAEKFIAKVKTFIKSYGTTVGVVLKYVMLIGIFYRVVIFPFLD